MQAKWTLSAAAILTAGCAWAVSGDPADPRATVPDPQYESVFTGYRPAGQIAVGDWQRLNAQVAPGHGSGPAEQAHRPSGGPSAPQGSGPHREE